MDTFLEKIGKQILTVLDIERNTLRETPLELSELTLMMDDAGKLALEFDVLGQNFLLKSEGLFTFNEVGDALTLEPPFRKEIQSYLGWRLKLLETFAI